MSLPIYEKIHKLAAGTEKTARNNGLSLIIKQDLTVMLSTEQPFYQYICNMVLAMYSLRDSSAYPHFAYCDFGVIFQMFVHCL